MKKKKYCLACRFGNPWAKTEDWCENTKCPGKPIIGRRVRVKGTRCIRTIERLLPNLAKGAVLLNKPVQEIKYWNMDQLVYV